MALSSRFEAHGERFRIVAAMPEDFQALVSFYDDVIAHTTGTDNDPQWKKNVHPAEQDLIDAIQEKTLWVCWREGEPCEEASLSESPEGFEQDNESEAFVSDEAEKECNAPRLVAAMILNGEQAPGYERASWSIDADLREVAVLHLFATHPAFQRRGIARQMLKFAADVGCDRGAATLRLDVISGNEVVCQVYEKAGFVPRGVCCLDYEDVRGMEFYLYDMIL